MAQRYTSPGELRAALREANGDWTHVLTPEQLATPLPPELWGGMTTVGAWLADGADERHCAHIFWVTQQRP